MTDSEIKIFKTKDGSTEISVKLDNDTVWLNQYQLEDLFQTDRSSITRHIGKIYKSRELKERSTCAFFAQVQKEGDRNVTRKVKYYNLDLIISVGYRVNSKRGTEFRIWANKILKEYLIKGFSINEKRLSRQNEQLKQLQETIKIIGSVLDYQNIENLETHGLLRIITDYAYGLDILDQYDYQNLGIRDVTGKATYRLTYTEVTDMINTVRKTLGNSDWFGREKDSSLKSSISTIYQTFDGVDLYPSVEEKAANLLYFVTKNHSFVDGNKRIAALLFLYFLDRNMILFDKSGNKRIPDNALVALTLMIAVSKPEEKDIMIKVIVSLINRRN